MATHDIPREQWKAFFEEFSRRHQGARVTVEAVDPRSTPHAEATRLPLVSISFDEGGSGGEAGAIRLQLGADGGDGPVSRTIANPKQVYHKTGAGVMSSEVNPDEILEVTAQGEPPITYLHITHPGE
jgi:hypothetical protein